jgi:Holliday junction resolvase
MMSTEFERELKAILEGDRDTLERVCRSCTPEERQGYLGVCSIPFIVIRAAGSFGVDLVAIRGEISLPIEVKSSARERLWLGKEKQMRQTERFHSKCSRSGVIPIYAFRLKRRKGDAWRIFTVPLGDVDGESITPSPVASSAGTEEPSRPEGTDGLSGRIRLIYNVLPKARVTPTGRIVLIWSDGMPLSRFLRYLASILAPAQQTCPDDPEA